MAPFVYPPLSISELLSLFCLEVGITRAPRFSVATTSDFVEARKTKQIARFPSVVVHQTQEREENNKKYNPTKNITSVWHGSGCNRPCPRRRWSIAGSATKPVVAKARGLF
jgi:hypothetical protein